MHEIRRGALRKGIAGEPSTAPAPEGGRALALDGLRGLAALSVFFSHARGTIPTGPLLETLQSTPVRIMWDGAAAVSLFFVLSGFVLSLPFVGPTAKRLKVADFLVRRVFRIYPAYVVTLILSLVLRMHGHVSSPEASAWFQNLWTLPITPSDLIRHAIMIGPKFDAHLIDPVVWTMVFEMRMSILMPALILLLRNTRARTDLLIIAAVVLFGLCGHLALAWVAPFFIAGLEIAKHRHAVIAYVHSLPLSKRAAFLTASLALYASRMFGSEASTPLSYASGLGAAGLILCVLCLPACNSIASSRVALCLGKISYSFYLVHLPIMICLASWLLPSTHSLLVCWVSSLCASVLVSAVIWYLVELPCQSLGKRDWPAPRAHLERLFRAV